MRESNYNNRPSRTRGYQRVLPNTPPDLTRTREHSAGVVPLPVLGGEVTLKTINDTLQGVLAQLGILAASQAIGGTYIAKKNIIDVIDSIAITNLAIGASATLLTLTVPAGLKFRLTHLGTFVRDAGAIGELSWVLRDSGNPVPPYDNIVTLNGLEGDPRLVISPRLIFAAQHVITLTAANAATAAAAFDAGGHLKGEIYAEDYSA